MDCLATPPVVFRILTHSIHIVSIPSYAIALYALISIKSKVFTTYRIFLIWHVVENLCFELYASFLVLPAINPPYALIRSTGLFAQLGVSPIIQFCLLSIAIEWNGLSISEMFYFRYKASLLDYREHRFTKLLQLFVYATRVLAIADSVFCVLTADDSTRFQELHKQEFLLRSPTSLFLLCPNIYLIVPFSDYVSSFLLSTWILQTIIPCASVPGTVVYVSRNVQRSISAATWKIQKQLLRSLTIQALIHGIMLGTPNAMFIYSFFFGYEEKAFGYTCFLLLTYHGFVSTFAMIMFTRPLREYISEGFGLRRKMTNAVGNSTTLSNT